MLFYLAESSGIASFLKMPFGRRGGIGKRKAVTMEPRKILLVDDSETILMMEQMILKKDGYEILTAKNGKEGVAKAIESKPDLILMDVVMPEMNGFEAVKQLRQHEALRNIPIVMVTTESEADSMEAGYENGCSDYIIKPIDRRELVTKVQSLLGE
ncbi:MAG: response regulator [Candidatus Binatia bacterium]